ncbi:MAG: hypothetical protein ABIN97_10805 [Ginsengibacter sp.]
MKKIQIVLIMGIIVSIITANASAQLTMNNLSKNDDNVFTGDAKGNARAYKSTAKLNKANSRALTDFKKAFKNEQDAKWFSEAKVMVATFAKNGIQTKVVYDKKGHLLHTIHVYDESKMPEDIRALVKRSIYYDYNITLVHQIDEDRKTFYIIDLSDGKKYKQVSVFNEDMNTLKEFDLEN